MLRSESGTIPDATVEHESSVRVSNSPREPSTMITKMAALWTSLMLVSVTACSATESNLHATEIGAQEVSLPRDAKAGMYCRWLRTGGDIVEEERACVEGPPGTLTIESRLTHKDGSSIVTAARFAADGALLGVWRGPRGGVGRQLQVVAGDADELLEKANAMGREHGVEATTNQQLTMDTIVTPAGPIACRRERIEASVLFFSGEVTSWRAIDPLPLSQLVRFKADMVAWDEQTDLVAYEWSGAVPTLQILDVP